MPRRPRESQVVPHFPHHVTLRGNNRRRLFSYPGDYARFISFVVAALERCDCRLHALTLMANHVHLIVTPASAGALAAFVQRFAQAYAQWRNRRRDSSGKLFEERYWCRPLLTAEQVASATAYVDLNGWRAGIEHNPFAYRWSTGAIHAGEPGRAGVPPAAWTPSAWYVELGASPEERAAVYVDFIRAYIALPRDEAGGGPEFEASVRPYRRRVERPDGTCALEQAAVYAAPRQSKIRT
jgi:putative transposase